MVITGTVAKIRVGYHDAAEIADWRLTRNDTEQLNLTEAHFAGRLLSSDKYWIDRGPFKLGLWMGQTWWVWDQFHLLVPIAGKDVEGTVVGNPVMMQDFR